MRMQSQLMTVAEVAERLGHDRSWIVRLVHAGKLPPVAKLPGRTGSYVFDPQVVDEYIRSNERNALANRELNRSR